MDHLRTVDRPHAQEFVVLKVLGPVEVSSDGSDEQLGGPKQRLVLALLAIDADRVVSVGRLTEALWRGAPPSDPRASLQVYVSNLRHALEPIGASIAHRSGGYVLDIDTARLDAHRFESLAEEGAKTLREDPQRAATLLRDALALWRGRPFGDLADEPALAAEVGRLEELRLRAIENRIDADLALGYHDAVVGEVRRLVGDHPLRERLRGQLMLALYRAGRQAEALAAFEDARRTLAAELGIDPSPPLRDLHARVLRQDPGLSPGEGRRDATATLEAIRVVRGYALLQELARRPRSTIYRGRHADDDRDVLVAAIAPEVADDPRFIRRFDAEARRSAHLEHPHLVAAEDHWREPGAAYVVWPRPGDELLAATLRRGPWRPEAAVGLVEQVAGAVDLLHARGIPHLDLGPHTVIVDERDDAHLLDTVVPRLVDLPTGDGQVRPGELDPGRDIKLLAHLTFELLTGEPPPRGHAPSLDLTAMRPDLPTGLDAALKRATTPDPTRHFESARAFAAAVRGAVTSPTAGSDRSGDVRNPYKGLRAFDESDADDFFGRARLVDELLERLREDGPRGRLLALVGPSGSGKSSVVRAGLVPAVRGGAVAGSHAWFVATMLPGEWPMAELERTLVEVAACDPEEITEVLAEPRGLRRAADLLLTDEDAELLLVVDQFEELFSLARGGDRDAFVDQIVGAVSTPDSRVRVVVTVRADFYDQALLHPTLGNLVADRTVAISGMSVDELERAVTRPALGVGVGLEPALVTAVVNDVASEPGALPLLQYALTEVFDHRSDRTLTLDTYRDIGGVRGALAGRAEERYASLGEDGKAACRQIFLRLVSVDEGGADTRRRVLRSELHGIAEDSVVDEVLETFGRHRLLTFDRDPFTHSPTVEVTHEALARQWGRLRGWIDAARDDILMHRRLLAATDEWRLADRDPSYLLRGSRLDEFAEWAQRSGLVLTGGERRYLEESLAAREAREAEEAARREHEAELERRSRRRLRALTAVLAIGLVVTGALSVFALRQRDRAQTQRTVAEEQRRIAVARELAAAAVAELDADPERSLLLAVEAVEATRDVDGSVLPEAEAALHRAVRNSRVEERFPSGGGLALSPDGLLAIADMEGTLTVRDAEGEVLFRLDDRPSHPLAVPGDRVPQTFLVRTPDVDFSPDGSRLATTDADFHATVVDARTGTPLVEFDTQMIRPRFSPDGATVAGILVQEGTPAGWDAGRTMGLWDAGTGELIRRFEGLGKSVLDHAFSPDGTRLVTAAPQGNTLRLWDVTSGEPVWTVEVARAKGVAYSPDGSQIAVVTAQGAAEVRDADSGDLLQALRGNEGDLFAAAFSPDGRRLATGGDDARVFDLTTGDELFALRGHDFVIADLTFTADGTRLVTSSEDRTTRVWYAEFPGGRHLATLPGPPPPAIGALAFSPDGSLLAASAADGIRLWDTTSLEPVRTLRTPEPGVRTLAFTPDGTRLAASVFTPPPDARVPGTLVVWDVASGEEVLTVGGHDELILGLAFAPDGRWVATAADNSGFVRVFDAESGELRSRYQLPEGTAGSLAFTPDGRHLLVGGQDALRALDPATGDVLVDFGADESILGLVLAATDRLVTGDIAGRVQAWDTHTGDLLDTVHRRSHAIRGVTVHDDLVAAAAPDGVALVDHRTGQTRVDLRTGHQQGAFDLAFSPDGRTLATTGADGSVRLFVIPLEDLLDLARSRVTRGLTEEECEEFLHLESCPEGRDAA